MPAIDLKTNDELLALERGPACVVDGELRVVRANAPLAAALGLVAAALTGRALLSVCGVRAAQRFAAAALKAAFDAPQRSGQARVEGCVRGTPTLLLLRGRSRATRAGGRARRRLIVCVEGMPSVDPRTESTSTWRTLDYEISVEPESFGDLRGATNGASVGDKCFRALYALDAPCKGCPLKTGDGIGVLGRVGPMGCPVLVSSEPDGAGTARVRSRCLPPGLASSIVEARIEQLGGEAGLSRRELEVSRLLHLGRSLDEIGMALGISTRTAKFHQANVLRKLGADSRHDLIRLLM